MWNEMQPGFLSIVGKERWTIVKGVSKWLWHAGIDVGSHISHVWREMPAQKLTMSGILWQKSFATSDER
jgi:hypothetical protein